MAEDKEPKKTPVWRWLLLGFTIVAVLWCGSLFWVLKNGDPTRTGTFGDSFGAVNALFSGLAFAGVIVAILLQKRELELQREELSDTRKEAERLSDASERQNRFLTLQAAQNQFFQMLSSWDRVVQGTEIQKDFDIRNTNKSSMNPRGRDAIQAIAIHLVDRVRAQMSTPDLEPSERNDLAATVYGEACSVYEDVHDTFGDQLGHCFRLLYNIVRYIHEEDEEVFNGNAKRSLIRILRAHLSQSELVLLMYSGLSQYGRGFYPFIEKYDLLQNLEIGLVPNPEHLLMYPRRFRVAKLEWLESNPSQEVKAANELWTFEPFHVYEKQGIPLDLDIRAMAAPVPGFPISLV